MHLGITNNRFKAKQLIAVKGIQHRDEIESLPPHVLGFGISNPVNIIHLIKERVISPLKTVQVSLYDNK